MLYASAPHEVDRLCRRLLALRVAAVGFDTEWRVTFRAGAAPRRTAVIQLCYQARALRASIQVGAAAGHGNPLPWRA